MFENECRMDGIIWIPILLNECVCLGMIKPISVRPTCVFV